MSDVNPVITEADVGRWFIRRDGQLRQVASVVPPHKPCNYPVAVMMNDTYTLAGRVSNRGPAQADLVRRATAADFLRLAMAALSDADAVRLAACLEEFADELEMAGSDEGPAVRALSAPPINSHPGA